MNIVLAYAISVVQPGPWERSSLETVSELPGWFQDRSLLEMEMLHLYNYSKFEGWVSTIFVSITISNFREFLTDLWVFTWRSIFKLTKSWLTFVASVVRNDTNTTAGAIWGLFWCSTLSFLFSDLFSLFDTSESHDAIEVEGIFTVRWVREIAI